MNAIVETPTSVAELAEVYVQAWNDHDLDAILELHTPETDFVVHGADGVQTWKGRQAVRECFGHLLALLPDQHIETQTLVVKEDFYVGHSIITGTLAMPWEIGGRTHEPTGGPISFEIVDIMHCQGNLIRVKEGWIDGLAIHNQLTRGVH